MSVNVCETGGHRFEPAGNAYTKEDDEKRLYVTLYCQLCGQTLEIVAVDRQKKAA